jgi:CDGSH iron-sulfur domain-containing protein 3
MTRDDSLDKNETPENVIRISADGPLCFSGRVEIEGSGARAALLDAHAELCRCGASENKPLCDGSHARISFSDAGLAGPGADGIADAHAASDGDTMKISPRLNGPLHVQGRLKIENARGEVIFRGDDAWLCRCGNSKHKPFCDGSHKTIGFRSGEGDGFPPSRKQV